MLQHGYLHGEPEKLVSVIRQSHELSHLIIGAFEMGSIAERCYICSNLCPDGVFIFVVIRKLVRPLYAYMSSET